MVAPNLIAKLYINVEILAIVDNFGISYKDFMNSQTDLSNMPVYVIIGDGRAACHFDHYLRLLNLQVRRWSRRQDPKESLLPSLVLGDVRVLLAIADGAIEPFVLSHPCLEEKCCIHFSGSLVTPLAFGAHPLFTFGKELYEVEKYKQMAFILEKSEMTFETLLPRLPNCHYAIDKELKPFYHALCVLSGNFTTILWQKFFCELQTRFTIPKEAAFPYLQQIANNLQKDSQSALTGPLTRGDHKTIEANLKALEQDPFKHIYEAFVAGYKREK